MNILVEIDDVLCTYGITNATYEVAKFNQSAVCLRTVPSEYINEEFLSGEIRKASKVEVICKDKDLKKAYEQSLNVIEIIANIDRLETTNLLSLSVIQASNTPIEAVTENGDTIYVTEFDVLYIERGN